ncbi:MAG: flagellar biosynthetic protein FliR [Gammaproteobacteria bacterium]|nr:flagellar biosynthetic protein FliR [Gammaproteobacteria bacterium]
MGQMIAWFSQTFWALLRVGGFLMVVPIFGNQLVSRRIRVAMAVAIAIAIGPLLSPLPVIAEVTLDILLQAGFQLIAGIGLGFATMIFFQLFVVAGQFIGMQMGLGFAAMVDPGNGVQVTALSQFFLMLVSMTFLAMNGHLVLLDVLITGFKQFPSGVGISYSELAWTLANFGGWMFVGGVLVALPAVISLLVVNLAFGVMSRSAPQLNVFSLGFPFSLVFGLVIVWFLIHGWLPQFDRLSRQFFDFTVIWMR